jgi:hypothetical protein
LVRHGVLVTELFAWRVVELYEKARPVFKALAEAIRTLFGRFGENLMPAIA